MGDDFASQSTDDIWVDAWFSIWYKPRATIRRIVDTNPHKFVILIAWLAGTLAMINASLNSAAMEMPGTVARFPHIGGIGLMVAAAIVGLFSVVGLYALGALYRWSGHVLGGTANRTEVRCAIAWAQVPGIYLEVATGVAALLGLYSPIAPHAFLISGIIGIWFFIISLKCLAEVHRFSAWRALGAILVGTLAVTAVIVGIAVTIWLAARVVGSTA